MSVLVVPEAIALEKRMPWAHGSEKLFENDSAKKGLGKGELALVAHLLGYTGTDTAPLLPFVGGSHETHDVSITQENVEMLRNGLGVNHENWNVPSGNFGIFEVKDCRSRTIRLGEEGMQEVSRNYEFFREVARDVKCAIEAMDEMLELTLSPAVYEALKEFAESDCASINAGSLPAGRAIGSRAGKFTKQKFGLYQAVKIFAQLKRARLKDRAKGWKIRILEPNPELPLDFKKTNLYLTMHQSNVVGTLKMNMKDEGPTAMQQKVKTALTKHLGFNGLEADLIYHLDHKVFDDPEMVLRQFEMLAKPSKAFAGINYLALVTDTHVEVIPRDRLDERLTLVAIGQGSRPNYSISELAV